MRFQINEKVKIIKHGHVLDNLIVTITNYRVEKFNEITYEVVKDKENKKHIVREEWCTPCGVFFKAGEHFWILWDF